MIENDEVPATIGETIQVIAMCFAIGLCGVALAFGIFWSFHFLF